MPYVTFAERYGMKKGEAIGEARGEAKGEARGEAKGLREAIALGLKLRFGPEGLKLLPRLRGVEEAKALRAILATVLKAKTLDAFREKLPRA